MSDVIPFKQRESDDPHITGPAKCVRCGHRWQAVTPVQKIQQLECPACHLETGALMHAACWGDVVFVCSCGNDFYQITKHGAMCINCGTHWSFQGLVKAFNL